MSTIAACQEFVDFLFCVASDFFTLHHKICGEEFDALHEVFRKYYDTALVDYDEMSEWILGLGGELGSPAKSAERIKYPCYECDSHIYKEEAIKKANWLIDQVIAGYYIINEGTSEGLTGCHLGFQNFIQGRLEYWAKELLYFNRRRESKGTIE